MTQSLVNIVYVLPIRFDGCFGLELGAGLGLCSIILGRVAKRLFCTGIELLITEVASKVKKNKYVYIFRCTLIKV